MLQVFFSHNLTLPRSLIDPHRHALLFYMFLAYDTILYYINLLLTQTWLHLFIAKPMIIFSLIDMVFGIESDMFHGCIFLIWVLLLQFLNFAHRVREELIYISLFERTRLSPHYFSWFSLAFAALSHKDNLFYIYQQENLFCIRLSLSLMPKAKMTWKKLVSIT